MSVSLPVRAASLGLLLLTAGCEGSERERVGVEVVLVNTTDLTLTELTFGYPHDSTVTWQPPGFDGAQFADLLPGGSARVDLPADREFGWGTPNPASLYAFTPAGDTVHLWDYQWCGTGYYTASVAPGTYSFALERFTEDTASAVPRVLLIRGMD